MSSMRKRIIVSGPALSRSGYGEQTRFALRALRSQEDKFDIYAVNLPWGATGNIIEDTEERQWIEQTLLKTAMHAPNNLNPPFEISLQVTIPNEWELAAPVNIGYTAGIETTKVAPQWLVKGNTMDKIIVVSEHAKQVYETTSCEATNQQTGEVVPDYRCETPITVVNYPVRTSDPKKPENIHLDYDFNFLTVAQWGPRKNLDNTIRWFVEEFKDEEIGLLIKTNVAKDCVMDRGLTEHKLRVLLAPYGERKCKVYLLHGNLSDGEMTWLYKNKKIKSLVSLTHGEGFGLPLFEAAYNALPIIAPLWSGQVDFLSAPNKTGKMRPMIAKVGYTLQPVQDYAAWPGVIEKDSMWCFPNEKDYKRQLREVYKNHGRFKAQANKLRTYILKNFTEEQKYEEFVDAVCDKRDFEFDAAAWFEQLNNENIETHD
tara:strand:- start:2680 stop:3966 length:1287 start_codon:yes stop_codon:yes gene_type:complete